MGALQTAFDFASSPAPVASVEQRLQQLLGGRIALAWTDNARIMVSARKRGAVLHVRLHHMFTDVDEPTLRAVACFLVDGPGPSSHALQHFIERKRDRIARSRRLLPVASARVPRARVASASPGRRRVRRAAHHHDLQAILHDINARYFEPALDACIGWARHARALGRRNKRRSIKLGSYVGRARSIRIHPVLDAGWVPRFFVEYIVYHELLHDALGMPVRNGRRSLHGPEFRARERMFERYAEALAWERANLDRLLGS